MNRVLVVAAHPDDEVLGCGATIAKHAAGGDQVHVLILAEGVTSREPSRSRRNSRSGLAALSVAARRASKLLGVKSVEFCNFPDNRMDSMPLLEVVKVIEQRIAKLRPEIVYTHHCGDVNQDHEVVSEAVGVACRAQPGHPVRALLFFETPSSTEWQINSRKAFIPDWFNDVSMQVGLKMDALRAYESELRSWPHPRSLRSVEHLARWRGATDGCHRRGLIPSR